MYISLHVHVFYIYMYFLIKLRFSWNSLFLDRTHVHDKLRRIFWVKVCTADATVKKS